METIENFIPCLEKGDRQKGYRRRKAPAGHKPAKDKDDHSGMHVKQAVGSASAIPDSADNLSIEGRDVHFYRLIDMQGSGNRRRHRPVGRISPQARSIMRGIFCAFYAGHRRNGVLPRVRAGPVAVG
ncbi:MULTISPECIES: hypothetical protein [Sphingobium]|uniref:hypothetical protein n=1 Tax=Sphingobium TaxID=165695 RepID=UPI001314EB55|nr:MULTISPECIES: hypothetical protein [Sphingobium]